MAIRPRAFALVVESTEISAFGEHPIAVEPCPCVAEAAVVFFDSTRARHAGVGSKARGEPGGDGGQRLSRVCNEVRVNEAEARMKSSRRQRWHSSSGRPIAAIRESMKPSISVIGRVIRQQD
jgi:hypothetical protein